MAVGRSEALTAELVHRAAERGPLRFDEVMEAALYHPLHGFYSAGGRAGTRRGDFLTSPEVGPLFGELLGRALDRWWEQLGYPVPFVVVEAGAGPGTLAASVRRAAPRCAAVLAWFLVEHAAAQRALHGERLGGQLVEDPVAALRERPGPWFASLSPADGAGDPAPEVLFANELLDNLPVRLAERTRHGWAEVCIAAAARGAGSLVEELAPLVPADAEQLGRLAPHAPVGSRAPLADRARVWLEAALASGAGRVVAIDYVSTTADMAGRPQAEWLRTYSDHGRGVGPLERLGEQDITCEVAVDQLGAVRAPDSDRRQADVLADWGIDELVAEGRRSWTERAHVGDLAAIAARSRVREAEALTDPAGLGAFRVLEWARPR